MFVAGHWESPSCAEARRGLDDRVGIECARAVIRKIAETAASHGWQ